MPPPAKRPKRDGRNGGDDLRADLSNALRSSDLRNVVAGGSGPVGGEYTSPTEALQRTLVRRTGGLAWPDG